MLHFQSADACYCLLQRDLESGDRWGYPQYGLYGYPPSPYMHPYHNYPPPPSPSYGAAPPYPYGGYGPPYGAPPNRTRRSRSASPHQGSSESNRSKKHVGVTNDHRPRVCEGNNWQSPMAATSVPATDGQDHDAVQHTAPPTAPSPSPGPSHQVWP